MLLVVGTVAVLLQKLCCVDAKPSRSVDRELVRVGSVASCQRVLDKCQLKLQKLTVVRGCSCQNLQNVVVVVVECCCSCRFMGCCRNSCCWVVVVLVVVPGVVVVVVVRVFDHVLVVRHWSWQ